MGVRGRSHGRSNQDREMNEIIGSASSRVDRERQWYAIQTRAKHEARVAGALGRDGLAAFLPTVKEVHRWTDRNKIIEIPLFPGYVFLHAATTQPLYIQVLRLPGVLRWIASRGEPISIPEFQMAAIRAVLANKVPVSRHPFIRVGQRVRVRGGCLDGIEGILMGHNDKGKLLVSVELLQRSMAISLAGLDVIPA